MEPLICPSCGIEMQSRQAGSAHVLACPSGHGVFLARADLDDLVEAESNWHRSAAHHTAPMPRITADMTAPPTESRRGKAWVETLFG